MAYAYVQKGYGFTSNKITWSQATGAGNLLVLCLFKANNAGEYVASAAGNVNTSQSWVSAAGTINTSSCKIATGSANSGLASATLLFLPGGSNAGGDTTTTLTLVADAGGNENIGAMEFSGIAATLPFIGYSLNAQTAPGTVTDAVTSNSASVSSVPALLAGFATDNANLGSGNATGTGFSGRGLDATTNAYLWGEDRRITSSGSVAATFTDFQASGDYTVAVAMAFLEATAGGTPKNQFFFGANRHLGPALAAAPLAWVIGRRNKLAGVRRSWRQDQKSRLFLPSRRKG